MGNTKYFMLSSTGANFTDLDLNYEGVSLTGEQISFVGSTKVDALFLRPGVKVNFTTSGAGADKIYLSGNLAEYTKSIAGSVMTLQRGSDASLESVSFIKGTTLEASDVLVFGDGTLSSYDLYNNLKNSVALPALNTTETSKAPLVPAAPNSPLDASIKAFALNPSGDTFAVMKPGVTLTAVGGLGADNIYVADGSTVDATLLGGGQDNIYLRGKWSDYSKSVSGSAITFTRTVDGKTESVKVMGGTGALNDKLYFADGSVSSNDAKTALKLDPTSPITAVAGFDPTKVTPGLGPTLTASALDNVNNLDVTSNIVLNYSEGVSAVAGKYLHIVNDGGTGFHGESATNTLDILVTDTSQVTISGGKVTINPGADLDLANNYHVTIDAGAFVGTNSQLATSAFDGTTALNFSTVTPGTSSVTNAVQSQAMDASGALVNSYKWLDIEGIGSPSATAGSAQDLSSGKIALVVKDYDQTGGNASSGYDGVGTGDFYIAADNFGADDLLYIDNQSASANDLGQTSFVDDGSQPTTLQFAAGITNGLGGFIDISLAGSTATFDSVAAMKSALGADHDPVYSDSSQSATTPPADIISPTLATSTPTDNATAVATGSNIVLTFSESVKAGNGSIVISNGTDTRTIAVTDTSQVTINGNTLTINPAADLTAGSTYNVQLAPGVLTDLAGNAYAGISNATILNFTTAAAVSTVTKIDWIAEQSGRILVAGEDAIEIQVHFSNPVVIAGSPQLQLTLVNDAGTSKTVFASFQQYQGMAQGGAQTSMVFVYNLQTDDQGQYHIGNVNLNGGSITEASWVGTLAADLTLSTQNTTITAGGYVYATMAGLTGTSGNDLLAPYEADPSTTPTNGVFAGVNGGDGTRDVLGVPVLLPISVTTLDQANQYSLKYNAAAGTIEAWAAGASTAAVTITAPAAANYPSGVEGLVYHLMFKDASGQYQYTDTGDLTLYNSVATYQDPVDANDKFVQGSMLADAINLSSDTSTSTRYLVRGSTGNDTITGHAGTDVIFGDGGSDSINAGDGNDRVFVGNGSDTVNGGAGNDKLVLTLPGQMMEVQARLSGPLLTGLTGNWTESGFAPTDRTPAYRLSVDDNGTLKVRDYNNSNNVTLASQFEAVELRMSDSDQRVTVQLQYGNSGNDTLVASATDYSAVMGLAGDDTLTASNQGNALLGGGGNDTLLGNTASDMLYGGAGDDSLSGGGGDDFMVGDAGNDTIDGGEGSDRAGFIINGSGTTPLSAVYDSVRKAVIILQGTTELAQISLNQDGSWNVLDLSSSIQGSYTSFGTDVVRNAEYLIFDYSGNTTGNYLTLTSSALNQLFAAQPQVSTVTKIDWTADQSGSVLASAMGDSIEIQVHFTNPVVVEGTPRLALTLVDDAGTSKTVYASFQPYQGMAAGSAQTSVLFAYQLQAGDQGRYHIGSIDLNGGGIAEASWVGALPADLTLSPQNTTITAGGYVYGTLAELTGTLGNDLLVPYEADPSTSPTNGVFTGVSGGDGSRDLLGVPVLLPSDVTTDAQASLYSLKYNASAGQIEVWKAGATSAALSVTAPAPANYPSGVEGLVYHLMFKDGSGQYQYTDTDDITLYNYSSAVTYTDPVAADDKFVQGTMVADAIDLSSDTSTATRYLVRGSTGNDTITGHAGTDVIFGDGGSDSINAGDGNDRVFVGNGSDTVNGGAGNDKLVLTLPGQMTEVQARLSGPLLTGLTGNWTESGFAPTDRTPAYRLSVDDNGTLKVRDYNNSNNVTLASQFEAVELRMSDSDQRVTVQLQYGNSGNDTLVASATDYSAVMGLAGDDTLTASSLGNALLGGGGNDTLLGNTASDMLYGGAGDDSISGGGGDDFMVGDAGNDTIDGGDNSSQGTDRAGFIVNGSGTTALTQVYDSARKAVIILQGTTELAQISLNQDGSWNVLDLSSSIQGSYTSFGTDVVRNAEYLIFDYSGNSTGNYLTLDSSKLKQEFAAVNSDQTAPTPLPESSIVNGNTLTLPFYEALHGSHLPTTSSFQVMVNGVSTAVSAVTVDNSNAYDARLILTLATPVVAEELVTVHYTDPSTGNDINAIQDLAGNDATSFVFQRVLNVTADPLDSSGPLLQSAVLSGSMITLNFSEALNESDSTLASNFSASVNGTPLQVSYASTYGNQVLLDLAAASGESFTPSASSTVTLTYTDPTAGNDQETIQDWSGNDAGTLSLQLRAVPQFIFSRPVQSTTDPTRFTSEIRIANGEGAAAYQVGAVVSNGATGVSYSYQSAAPDGWVDATGSAGIGAVTDDPNGLYVDPNGTLIGWVTADFVTAPTSAFRFNGSGLALQDEQSASLLTGTAYQAFDWTPGSPGDARAPHVTVDFDYPITQQNGFGIGIRIDLSETAVGFDSSAVTVTGGTLTNLDSFDGLSYTGTFIPKEDFIGNAGISVAAGAFTDLAGNANLAAVPLSIPIDTVQPRVNSASFTETAYASVSLVFDESMTQDTSQSQGLSVYRWDTVNQTTAEWIAVNTITVVGSNVTLELGNSTPLSASDVIRLKFNNALTDAEGHTAKTQEVFVGGSGNNQIDLSHYGSYDQIMLRGNAGADTLVGSYGSDTLIDGKGADYIEGSRGGDVIKLVENSSTGYSRDIVHVGLGDSRAGVRSATDYIGFSTTTPTGSGFDTFSTDASQHDVLDLPSDAIAANVSHAVGSQTVGSMVKHSITDGIVTFEDTNGNAIAINGNNVADAVKYLAINLKQPGMTAAFKFDADSNGNIESLYLFQDTGVIPVNGVQTALTDIGLRIEYADPSKLASVVLGNSAGANVLQLQDSTAPEPTAIALTTDGIQFTFSEAAYAPAGVAMTLQKNGTDTAYKVTSVDGDGSAVLTLHASGLSLAATDWALFSYQGLDSNSALKDAAGNYLYASIAGFAIGGAGNNTINLSGSMLEGSDIEGMGGNDTITGTAYNDWISGGIGADKLTGGDDFDEFGFEQGDSPAVTALNLGSDKLLSNGDTLSFANGVDQIMDLSSGDTVYLEARNGWLNGVEGLHEMLDYPIDGQVSDQGFFLVLGSYSSTSKTFTVDDVSGSDTLVVYDGDSSSGVSQTGLVLTGVVTAAAWGNSIFG